MENKKEGQALRYTPHLKNSYPLTTTPYTLTPTPLFCFACFSRCGRRRCRARQAHVAVYARDFDWVSARPNVGEILVAVLALFNTDFRHIGPDAAIHSVCFEIGIDAGSQPQLDVPVDAAHTNAAVIKSAKRHGNITVNPTEPGGTSRLSDLNFAIDAGDFD